MATAQSQIVIHRDKSMMYYGYVRKLDVDGRYFGMCVLLNDVMLTSMDKMFSLFETIFAEQVSKGELIKLNEEGDIVAVVTLLNEKQQEVENVIANLREEMIRMEQTASKLPPIDYSKAKDSCETFKFTDKNGSIVEASSKYAYTCIQKDTEFDIPLLANFRAVLKKRTEAPNMVEQNSHIVYVREKERKEDQTSSKKVVWIFSIVVFIIALIFVPKNCSKGHSDTAIDSLATDLGVIDSLEADSVLSYMESDVITKAISDSIELDKSIIEFITDMYNNEKYWDNDFIKRYCSAKMLKYLHNKCPYPGECGDAHCYCGRYLFGRASYEIPDDPELDEDLHKIISVKPIGEHWYKYDCYDHGIRATISIKVVKNGDVFIIEGLSPSDVPMESKNHIVEEYSSHSHNWLGYDGKFHHLVGTMKNEQAFGHMELRFVTKSDGTIEDVIYKNLDLGGRIRMKGFFTEDGMLKFVGKDGSNDFILTITDVGNGYYFEGYAVDGNNSLIVQMTAECDHH